MRIDELTFSQARSLKPEKVGSVADVKKSLQNFGYELAGKGLYSEVYQKAGSNVVVKVNAGQLDKCWVKFAEIAKQNKSDQHLPKIGRIMVSKDDYMIVFIEKLNDQPTGSGGFVDEQVLSEIDFSVLVEKPKEEIIEEFGPTIGEDLIETILMLDDARGSCNWDLHPGNIMWRGNTPVITDPWA